MSEYSIDKFDEHLFRIRVPFEDLYTSVYAVKTDDGVALIDTATYPSDADNYIIPALASLGVSPDGVSCILLTHTHSDHAGGTERLAELCHNARVYAYGFLSLKASAESINDGDVFLGVIKAMHLPGHTGDSTAYLDMRTNTLLTGDCLQLFGVGKYTNGVGNPTAYSKSIERLRTAMVDRIVAAHEYEPLGSVAEGSLSVGKYLDLCIAAISDKVKKSN